jgi:aspartate ammonia-lyase
MVRGSIGIVTALNPYIGYKASTKVAKEALETGGSVYDIVLEKGLMTKEKLDEALDPKAMLGSHEFIK